MFDRGDGRPLPPSTVTVAFARAVRRAGLPRIRLHDLRHGFATLLARLRVLAKMVSAMLGHVDVRITLDLYTHLDLVDQAAAVDALDAGLAAAEADRLERDQIRDRGDGGRR